MMTTNEQDKANGWTTEWPKQKGHYFAHGQFWESGSVELRVVEVWEGKSGDFFYVMSNTFLYRSEQPDDLLWWGPIPTPPEPTRIAKVK